MAGESPETPNAEVSVEAPPQRLEQRLQGAMAGVPAAVPERTASAEQPSVDGLPLEPGPAVAQQAAPEWQSVRDYAKAQGLELPYDDDAAALNDLIRARRQLEERNYYSELGQRVAPHADQFREWVRQRQQPVEAPKPWEPPPFDEKWLAMVERDEATGALRSKPGFDPAVAERVQAVADWRDRYQKSPESVIAPLIEQRSQALIEKKFAEYQQQVLAQETVRRHSSWLYQRDAQGEVVSDDRGQPRFSPAGVVYASEARRVHDAGITDVREMDRYARLAAENAVLRGRYQQERPPGTAAPTPVGPPVGGALRRPTPNLPAAPASQKGLSLQERLRNNMRDVPEDISIGDLSDRARVG